MLRENSDYVELHAHSHFSLLDGASSPGELADAAAALGMEALALTDHDAVYGAPQFAQAARAAGIKSIFGAELTLHDDTHLTLLVQDSTGWANLCALITHARLNAGKGAARLPKGLLEQHTAGLIALSGCVHGRILSAVRRGDQWGAVAAARHLAEVFGRDHFWIELQHHLHREDARQVSALAELAESVGVGIIATNNVHYATPDHHRLHDVLTCIRHNTDLDTARQTGLLRTNAEYRLKSGAELQSLFARYPQALTNTRRIAAMCDFTLEGGLQSLPTIPTSDGMSADEYLHYLCNMAFATHELPAEAAGQLTYELDVIRQCGLSNYFLVVWDVVRFARERGIRCQGRGSAANSLVAYLLNISPINPLDYDLLFERFLSTERQVIPDIDIDFNAARREEVIQYVYAKYGRDHAAMACTFVTFCARSAVRDVGKAFGLPQDILDHVTTVLDTYRARDLGDSAVLREQLDDRLDDATWTQIVQLAQQLEGVPRHLGIHNGGMVVTGSVLAERVPVENATMEARTVVQWDKEGLEDAGLVKLDILGLRMLSAITEAVELVGQQTGMPPDLEALRFDDPRVYDMICAADTVGVFQVESRAQAQGLPRLLPRTFNDLIVSISLIRPGPVQGEMVHPYLRRRDGREAVTYVHPLVENAVRETLGVILFQEQVLKIARDFAGFTPGQGELLRRALGAKDPGAAVARFYGPFIAGAAANGVSEGDASAVFNKLSAFAGYSFPKSHAAAFAVLVYQSAWLKCYYPAAFTCALLNHQPMGFWSPAVLVNDARRHGVAVRSVDIARSAELCTLEDGGIRLGFNYVSEVGAWGERLVQARAARPFVDLTDLMRRVPLPRRIAENLIAAGALDSWGERRALLWTLGTLPNAGEGLPLPAADPIALPALSGDDLVEMEHRVLGLTTRAHPLAAHRERLRWEGMVSSADLTDVPSGARVQVAGLLVIHQAPGTAKGFRFLTLEDEFGFLNIIIRPKDYSRFRQTIRRSPLLRVTGVVQNEGQVVNVVARGVARL